MSGSWHDLRLGLRALQATPYVTAFVVVSLAVAIGANTAIFSIVNALLLRGLPLPDPKRLVHVTDAAPTNTGEVRLRAWSYPVWEQFKSRPELFDGASAWAPVRLALSTTWDAQSADVLWADGSFFDVLGVTARVGRTFKAADDEPGGGPAGPVVIMSYGYWQRQYGGSPDVIGGPVSLGGVPFTIIGVTPPEFFGLEVGRTFDFIVPVGTEPLVRGSESALGSASTNFLRIVARLRPGESVEAMNTALRQVQREIREATIGPWPQDVRDQYLSAAFTAVPVSTAGSPLRRTYERPLLIVAVIVALVVLIGCVNVANLLLARANSRRHQLSVQVALGASRWRLARQSFAESAALAVVSAAFGLLIASTAAALLVQQLSTPTARVFLDVSLDARVLAFAVGLTILTTLLFGMAPALLATRAQPVDALKGQGKAPSAEAAAKSMDWLVSLQVALSLVLLVGAGLFVRSFVSLSMRDLGFDPHGLVVVSIDPQRAGVEPGDRVGLYEQLREAVRQIPNVSDAALSLVTPLGGGGFTPVLEVTTPAGPRRLDASSEAAGNLISSGWFGTYGARVTSGRDFTDVDRAGSMGVAIVNESFVRKFLEGGDPLAQTLTIYPGTPRALTMQIVGVATDAVFSSPRETPPPTWYVPLAQFSVEGFPFVPMRLTFRARDGSPALATRSVAAAILAINPRLALTTRSLPEHIHAALGRERLMAHVAGCLGIAALLLAGLGLHAVTAFAVSQRRREIGIRLALGAAPHGLVRAIIIRVATVVGIGTGVGLVVTLWASKFIEGLLFRLPSRDLLTLGAAAGILFAAGLFAAWLPARRASRIDPAAVLRET